jgi:predicted kinase
MRRVKPGGNMKQKKKREQKVPEKVILRLLEKTELPTVMEGHGLVVCS